jgi:hypothetical protein
VRPVSTAFLAALRGSHAAPAQAFVVAAGQTGTSPTGTELAVIGGDVQMDAAAAIRSTLAVTVSGEFPDQASDSLTPYGNEIFVRRGVAFGGGRVEWVSLGYFRIQSVEQDDRPDAPVRIAAQDRMAGIVEARLITPQQFAATALYEDVVNDLVTEVYPWATVEWDDTTGEDPLGRSLIAEEDRWKFLDDLVTSRGKIWYWDHRGVLVIRTAPDPDEPVWEVNAGADGVLIAVSRDLSREGVYNAVVASGEALDTEAPPTAVAVDDNPDSPTYWNGSFGKVPRFYSSPFITTTGQAETTAAALLRAKLGLPYNVHFQAIVNPALEPWDPVAVNPAGTRNPNPARRVAADSFTRTVADSWGTADTGQSWTLSGTAANFDVTGGVATSTAPTANLAQYARLAGVDESDVEGYFTASVPNAATGASLLFGAVARRTGSGDYYLLSFEFGIGGTVGLKIWRVVSSAFGELAALNPIPDRTYTAGQRWRVRWRVAGTGLKVKAWPEGDAEPPTWMVTATDTTYTSGGVGVLFWRVFANTNTGAQFAVDDVEVTTVPGLTPGAEVHVIERLTVPLAVTDAMSADTREQTLIVIGDGDA